MVDLPGWTGPQPAGTEEETKGGRGITASRSYLRGDARFNASIISGTAALATGSRAYIYFRGVHQSTATIDGFQVTTQSTPIFVLIAIKLSPDMMLDSSLKDVKQNDCNNEVAASSGREQIDDILNGLVGAVVGDFESAVRAILRVRDGGGSGCWQVVRTAVCGRTEIAKRLEHPLR